MKKGKNITLLIGIACAFAYVLFLVIQATFYYGSIVDKLGYLSAITSYILPFVIAVALLVFPTVLLVRNLKNKTGKVLPIVSAIINCLTLFGGLYFSFVPAIPNYLILNELGLIDIYSQMIVNFLKNGGILLITGYVLLIIGSFLSFPKKKKQKAIDDENTALTNN